MEYMGEHLLFIPLYWGTSIVYWNIDGFLPVLGAEIRLLVWSGFQSALSPWSHHQSRLPCAWSHFRKTGSVFQVLYDTISRNLYKQKFAMSEKIRLADCFDCFVRIWQFPGFPVLGHIQYRSFLCLYYSDGPFSLWDWHGAPANQVASICESTLMSICDAFVKKCTSYPWSSLYLGFKLLQASSSSLITAAGRLS